MKEEKILEAKQIMKQNILDLNNRMEQCESSLTYLVSNYTLQQFIQMDETDYLKVNQESKSVGPLLYNAVLSNQYFYKLRVYTEKDFFVMNDLLKEPDEVRESQWYQETIEMKNTYWGFEDGKYFLAKRIATAYPVKIIGVIRVDLKNSLFTSSFNIFKNMPVKIEIDGKHVLYQNDAWYDDKNSNTYTEKFLLKYSDWSLSYHMNRAFFYPRIWMTLAVPMMVIILVLLIVGVIIHLLMNTLLKEVNYLVERVNEAKKGNLDVVIEPMKTEEINLLADSINDMLRRIRQLIHKVYVAEIDQKSLELDLLRSKISPHFLYNNLSAINWIALDNDQMQIHEITTQMATFYRTALNKGRNIDKLSVEITNIKAYISLQLMSHENSFDVCYEIDDRLLECYIPTFILQPLVENALEHGVDLLRVELGKITVKVYEEKQSLIIQVYDNGKKLYETIGEGELERKKYGYGTSNVHKRVQLVMGENFGLVIKADSLGTTSTLKLKLDSEKI